MLRRLPCFFAILWCCSLAFVPCISAQDKPAVHPIVLAFERFHSTEATANVAGGQLLLGELNCTSCHTVDTATSAIVKKQAPILTNIGDRANPEYLAKFLTNPQTTKPGTSMPNVFAALPEAEAKAKAEALAHFLSSTGELNKNRPMRSSAMRGDDLYHNIGCVACHGPRKEGLKPIAGSIPLGTPSRKYTYDGLTRFLKDPLAVRPSGRMPHLNLNGQEASDLAAFLLSDIAIASPLTVELYEGSFNKLPDFSTLKPKSSVSVEKFDISKIERKENFALRFSAEIAIENEGNYNFYIKSDDGSRITIDSNIVADNDGIHGEAEKEGRAFLKKGKHAVLVEYFEQSGGESLQVEVKGPKLERGGLERLLAPPEQPATATPTPAWQYNAELAAKGKEIFTSAGCASCHTLQQNGQALVSTFKAEPLAKLKNSGGCLNDMPNDKHPHFAFKPTQQQAIMKALTEAKQASKLAGEALVQGHMERFNCYGCHLRNEMGGVEDSRNEWFIGTMKEVGDEARLPPYLTGVGGKLKPEWLKKVLADGEKVRSYMLTRMPKFGAHNIEGLAETLTATDADKLPPAPLINIADTDRKFKASGKQLVGSQGLSCIKCHTFNGKGTPGIQVMDLNIMASRLNEKWFHHYMLNPPALRPNTRMPAAWPNGQAVMKNVLDGDTNKQIRSVWAYLLDGSKAAPPSGLVEAKLELYPLEDALIYRNFIDGAGPRAIAVGYSQKAHYAWDANHARLALIWQGGFIDASMHWVGRGPGYQKPLGDNVYTFPVEAPLAILEDTQSTPWPKTTGRDEKDPNYKFLGYKLGDKGNPTFMYRFGDVTVEETLTPKADGPLVKFQRTLSFQSEKAPAKLYFLAGVGNQVAPSKEENAIKIDEALQVTITGATPEIREANKRKELLVPVKWENGKATINLEYDW